MEKDASESHHSIGCSLWRGQGSAGSLTVIDPGGPEETRLGKVIAIPGCLYSIWGDKVPGTNRGANSVWFTDDVAALMALVKDSGGSYSLDQMAKIIHLTCLLSGRCLTLKISSLVWTGWTR